MRSPFLGTLHIGARMKRIRRGAQKRLGPHWNILAGSANKDHSFDNLM